MMDKAEVSYKEIFDKTIKMDKDIGDVCSSISSVYAASLDNNETEVVDQCLEMYSMASAILGKSAEVMQYFGNKAWLERQRKVDDE